MFMKT
jgi:hypothetical protein